MSRYLIFIISFLLVSTVVFAQSKQAEKQRIELYRYHQEDINKVEQNAEKQRLSVDQLVKQTGLERSFVKSTGEYVELVGVDLGGNPVYYETMNQKAAQISNFHQLKNNSEITLEGDGVLIGVFDSSLLFTEHQEFTDNKNIVLKSDYPQNFTNWLVRRNYRFAQLHSTHVTGTLLSAGIQSEAKGIVPGANLWSFDWLKDIRDMYYSSLEGMIVSNHSYGIAAVGVFGELKVNRNSVGAYESRAVDFDYVTQKNDYYTAVVAAGNNQEYDELLRPGGLGHCIILGIATSKNAIVVGAGKDFVGDGNINDLKLANYSSRGPTLDFRIKPDIIANGTDLFSTLSDIEESEDYVLKKDLYGFKSGTSMATPIVTGAVAIWQQWSNKYFGDILKAASIRALLVQSAHVNNDMIVDNKQISLNNNMAPNPSYGWGVLDVMRGIEMLKETISGRTYLIEDGITNKNDRVYVFENYKNNNSLNLTLAWTDPAGPYDYNLVMSGVVTKALVNDLDIRVKVGNTIFLPWTLRKNLKNPSPIISDNDVDNLERITIANLPKGKVEIKVTHKGNLEKQQQNYSLILSTKERMQFVSLNRQVDDVFKKVDESLISELSVSPIVLWPNPVMDKVNLLYDSKLKIYRIALFNNSGQQIQVYNNFSGDILDVRNLTAGLYIAKANTSEGNYEFKLIKK